MAARKPKNSSGWTAIGSDLGKETRHEHPPTRFYSERIHGDPVSPAWDEPGYFDPDLTHEGLPPGSRYWQGFAEDFAVKKEERALSPSWVAEVTADISEAQKSEKSPPQRSRTLWEKERDR